MNKKIKIFVAGGTGFLGKRIINKLESIGHNYCSTSLSQGVDFRDLRQVINYFEKEKPEIVINCAACVGGIQFVAEHEGEIYFNNILISANLIECARRFKVQKFINPISNCSYPDVLEKDFKESEWWNGPLHPSVLVYGFVKKAIWVQANAYYNQYRMKFLNFIIPNMYGPEDHFDEFRSHALGALITKIVKAKEIKLPKVIVWGTGKPIREWLYVDDCVEVFTKALDMEPMIEPINIGQGKGITIKNMAEMIKRVVNYEGELVFDDSRPDGAPRKVMNIDKMEKIFNWLPPTKLEDGIKNTVDWYYKNHINK